MKQTKQFLRPLLMAIVMLAMSPASLWAAQVDGMDIPEDPLCFEAKEDGAMISIGEIVSDYVLYYSLDNKNT